MLHSTGHLGEGDGEDGVRETEAPAPFAWRWVRSPTEGKEGRPGFCGTDEVTTQKTVGKNMWEEHLGVCETPPGDRKEERERCRVVWAIYWLSLKETKSRARVETSESNEFVRERLSKREEIESLNIKDGGSGIAASVWAVPGSAVDAGLVLQLWMRKKSACSFNF